MKSVLVVLALVALPQTVGLSTRCSAGARTSCSTNLDGSCTFDGTPCGANSQGTSCDTRLNPNYVTAAGRPRPGPAATKYLCECR